MKAMRCAFRHGEEPRDAGDPDAPEEPDVAEEPGKAGEPAEAGVVKAENPSAVADCLSTPKNAKCERINHDDNNRA